MVELDYTHERQLLLESFESQKEGWIEGWKEGWGEAEKIEIVLCMLQAGKLSMEEIAEYSGFELKKVEQLAKDGQKKTAPQEKDGLHKAGKVDKDDAVLDKERKFLLAWDRMGGKSEGYKAGQEETALCMLWDGGTAC